MTPSIVQHRRGDENAWKAHANLVLKDGEIGIQFNNNGETILKVGDGVTKFKDLKSISAGTLDEVTINKLISDKVIAEVGDVDDKISTQVREALDEKKIIDSVDYTENQLRFYSNGVQIMEPITIVGGGSGGVGGYYVDFDGELISDQVIRMSSRKLKEEGCEITFSFTSNRKMHGDDSYIRPTGKFKCEIFVRGDSKEILTLEQGTRTVDIAKYLVPNNQEVIIKCSDMYGNEVQFSLNVTIVELSIFSTFRDSIIYDSSKEIVFPYRTYPAEVKKTLHLSVDGGDPMEIDAGTDINQKSVSINNITTNGVHTITAVVSTSIGEDPDDTLYSEQLSYEFIYADNEVHNIYIASCLPISDVSQGTLLSIPYQVYYPPTESSPELKLSIIDSKGEYFSKLMTADRDKHYWDIYDYPLGDEVQFKISCNGVDRVHTLKVTEGDISIEHTTSSLQLFLTADGRDNTDANREIWEFPNPSGGDSYKATLKDFNWVTNGWMLDDDNEPCLRLTGKSRVTIDYDLFGTNPKATGRTIEFEFAVRDVNTLNSVAISCLDKDGIGFKATADEATLSYRWNSIHCYYKENKKVRVSIVIDNDYKFMSIYLNGVLTSTRKFADDVDFTQSPILDSPRTMPPIEIGSDECSVDLYTIRVYNQALSETSLLNNYLYDTNNYAEKSYLYTSNNVLDPQTNEISYKKVLEAKTLPVVVFIGKLPEDKGDVKSPEYGNAVRMIFNHPTEASLNFDEILKELDVQGTTSQYYPRKNWKIKTKDKKQHMTSQMSASTFCIKVDYAEATGTHNTQNANLVETFYTKKVLPQYANNQVRTTITGFPILIFVLETDNRDEIENITQDELLHRTDLKFYAKGNFNFDKGAENVFGFTTDYDTECWEFCDSASGANNFSGEIPVNYAPYFEARYHPQLKAYKALKKAKGEDDAEVIAMGTAMISRFKEMHDWVRSTNKNRATGERLSTAKEYDSVIYEYDTKEYRLAKFKNEFHNYFDEHYTAVYYVYTFFALMTDQRAKNLFLTYWKDRDDNTGEILDSGHWYPYFYDNDTCFGLNNTGSRVFDYYHEDSGEAGTTESGDDVFNGQQSVLWNNFRECFPRVIQSTYDTLRKTNLKESKLLDAFITNGSDKWCATIYNADSKNKYVCWALPDAEPVDFNKDGVPDKTEEYLYQVRGTGEFHLEYFLSNRFKYCDSKWHTGNYFNDYIYLRIYTPDPDLPTCGVVPPTGELTVVPYSNYYAGIHWGAPSADKEVGLYQAKVYENQPHTFLAPTNEGDTEGSGEQMDFNEKDVYIYGASYISEVCDLAPFYCELVDIKNANRLTHLKIGDSNPYYENKKLRQVTLGNNKLLSEIDVSNCKELTELKAENCDNLKVIKAKGTKITTLALPKAGYIETLELPDTIQNLTLNNQMYLTTIDFDNYRNLYALCIDNCPKLDAKGLLDNCWDSGNNRYTVERVRITGISKDVWKFDDANFLLNLSKLKGYLRDGTAVDYPVLEGTCYVESLSGAELADIKSKCPDLTIEYGTLTDLTITYKSWDGGKELWVEVLDVTNGSTAKPLTSVRCPVLDGKVSAVDVQKEPTNTNTFEWAGWSLTKDSAPNSDSLTKISYNTTLYAAYTTNTRYYKVTFYNGTTKLNTDPIEVEYGGTATYPNEGSLKKPGTSAPYRFYCWEPSNINITSDRECFAKFTIDLSSLSEFDVAKDFTISVISGNKVALSEYTGTDKVGRVPRTFVKDSVEYIVQSVGGFADSLVEYVYIDDGIESISPSGFFECSKLEFIHLPNSINDIGISAFKGCTSLKEVIIPSGVIEIKEKVFMGCTSIKRVILHSGITRIGNMSLYNTDIEHIVFNSKIDLDWLSFKTPSQTGRASLTHILLRELPTVEGGYCPFETVRSATFWCPMGTTPAELATLQKFGQDKSCKYIIETENGYPLPAGGFVTFTTDDDFYKFVETYQG